MSKQTLRIGKQEVEVKQVYLDQVDLRYYAQNPRVYTMLGITDDSEPSQEEIQKRLQSMEHVKELVQAIQAVGGLTEPIVVRDNIVLEGNSRLAAYRKLYERDPDLWSQIKCTIIPTETTDDDIFILLGQYHIVGRKDWSPYEQAAYIFRRKQKSGISIKNLAIEIGRSESVIANMVKVYEYMVEKNDLNIDKWSYYDEFLKSRHIQQKVQQISGLEEKIVKDIQCGGIEKARFIRDLANICKSENKSSRNLLRAYSKEEMTFEECLDDAKDSGDTVNAYMRLNKFRKFIAEFDVTTVARLDKEARDKILFELEKIQKITKTMYEKTRIS